MDNALVEQPWGMSTLHIRLLGDFHLIDGEAPVAGVNSARLQALLAYLVLHPQAPQSRRHLAFLLWPDSRESQARSNLRNLLHLLRHALPHADDFLQIDATTVQWRSTAPYTLDVVAFTAALAAADAAQAAGDASGERAALENASARYRGDLLPDCYEDWLQPERERLRQLCVTALERLISLLAQHQDAPAAIRTAQRLLRMDPLHETTYQQLMRLYTQLGDRAHALNTYHTCVTVLQRELGVKPSAATQALYQRLQAAANHPQGPAPRAEAPPASPRQHNLPALLTSFVGRTEALTTLKQALGTARLLTLTGPGGCGKTRLALAVAADLVATYPAGVWLVELGGLRTAAHLLPTLAGVLHIAEEPSRALLTTVVESLRDQRLLLVLDTCEHLIDSCAELVQTLLHACPHLQVLATSRERLAVAGEMVWPVPLLTLPPLVTPISENPAQLLAYEAVQLLVERIQAVWPAFTLTPHNAPALCQICVHLDGLPLALELAAARAALFSVQEIAAHLDHRFQLLQQGARDATLRHQTLAAAIDWSYDRLPAAEQVLLRRLALFDSTFTLAAVQGICTDWPTSDAPTLDPAQVLDLLAHLVDKSLVNVILQPAGATRYGLLETIRAYGAERLAAADEVVTGRNRHLAFFRQLAESAAPQLRGSEQVAWLDQLATEQDNLRTALHWAVTAPAADPIENGLRLGGALWRFWIYRGHYSEGRAYLTRLLTAAAPTAAAQQAAYAQVLVGAGCLAGEQGEYSSAQQWLEQALARYQALALPAGIAEAIYSLAGELARRSRHRAPLLRDEHCPLSAIAGWSGAGLGAAWSGLAGSHCRGSGAGGKPYSGKSATLSGGGRSRRSLFCPGGSGLCGAGSGGVRQRPTICRTIPGLCPPGGGSTCGEHGLADVGTAGP
jgi:predicted ATPase/DNA-binding SARP family transcriptional activator